MRGGDAVDPEVLAALLDGRLSADERAAVLERLATTEAAYDAFVDAAAVLSEIEASEPKVEGAVRIWRRAGFWLPLAAVLAAALLVPLARSGGPGAPAPLLHAPALVASAGDGSLTRVLGANWEAPGWSVRRGATSDALTPDQRATRLGMRAADLRIALEAGDGTAARAFADELRALLLPVAAAAPLAAEYAAIGEAVRRGAASDSLRALATAADGNVRAFVSPWWDLGSWLEQARLAALVGNPTFFGRRTTRALTDAVERLNQAREPPRVPAAVQLLRRSLAAGVSPEGLSAFRAHLAAAILQCAG